MDDSEPRTAKRSRFDQTEPEPRKASRFDRRSRSPHSRREEPRERSPLRKDDTPETRKSPVDAAAAAGMYSLLCALSALSPWRPVANPYPKAAAAARINAQLQSRKGIQHVDVPPIQSSISPPPAQPAATPSSSGAAPTHAINGEMYVADGDYIQDIEVNDLRNRYLLTKGSTQKMVKNPC